MLRIVLIFILITLSAPAVSLLKRSDLSYGPHPLQTLDLYYTKGVQNAPIIVMVHGGAWRMGDKEKFATATDKVNRWVPKGAILISLNYRLLPAADPLTQTDDIAKAMVYIQHHAKTWGGDRNRIVLMGHSSGGHLVSLLSTTQKRYRGLDPWLATISLDAGALDVVELMRTRHYPFHTKAFSNNPRYWEAVSPYAQLNPATHPMLLVCSEGRKLNPCQTAMRFAQKASELGVKTQVLPVALNHFKINRQLGKENAYTHQVEAFMRSVGMQL